MASMTVMPRASEWTVDDLDRLPDDGLRYELLDGVLLVSPAPSKRHQRVVASVFTLLRARCPAHMEVLFAPLDWRPDGRTSLQPDVMVLAGRDLDDPVADTMILTIEVLSPTGRRKDAVYKRSKYEDERVPGYWIIDPGSDSTAPSMIALELVDGRYVTVGEASGGGTALTLDRPFPITIVPADLVAD